MNAGTRALAISSKPTMSIGPEHALPHRTPSPDRPLDVLHVTESLGHGGAEQNLLSILKRLPREGYRHHLAWLFSHDERLLEAFRPLAATMLPLGVTRGTGLVAATARLAAFVRRVRPDVVHAQLIKSQVVGRLAAAMAGVPVVTTWQSAFYDDRVRSDFGTAGKRAAWRWLDAATGRLDARFIAVSEHVARAQAAALGVAPDRVTVIYNALDPERFETVADGELARTRAALDLAPDDRVLLTVGRLVPGKAHADLVGALPAILRREPRAVVLVAGGGALEEELRAQARALTLGDRVRLLGARKDVAALYQIADLYAFPTRNEGLSVALLEALANGLPAVVSDIPQNREVADGLAGVRFFPVGDRDALAAAAVELLAAGRAARLDDVARRELHRRFDPSLLAARFGETLARAAAR